MPSRVPNRNIKKSTIEENRQRLLNAPVKEKEDFSLQEAIHNMAAEINQILDRGYSYEEIATMLSDGGIDVKPTTLRQYLAQVTKATPKSKSKKSPKIKADEIKSLEVESSEVGSDLERDRITSAPVEKSDRVNPDDAEKTAKPSKPTVKVDKKANSGFVEMPDKL